jgi:hypothetical protein
MALLDRFVDLVFRGLDAADAAKDRLDQALGRDEKGDPWVVRWPPPPGKIPRHADAPKSGDASSLSQE